MPREISPERKKLVILISSFASMSAAGSLFTRGHHVFGIIWMIVLASLLVYVIAKFIKLRRTEGCNLS